VSGAAAPGSHTARVTQLARAQVMASKTFASDTAGIAGTGGVQITVGGVQTTINYANTDSLTAIAQRINDNTSGIEASVLDTGSAYQIVITAAQSGTAAAASYVDIGPSDLGLSIPAATKVAATDLNMTIDGIAITRPINVVADALPGMTFTANAVAATDTMISVTNDKDAIATKVQGLVDAYNAVAKVIDGQLRYDGKTKGQETLFGDATLRRLQMATSSTMSAAYSNDRSLRDLGITVANNGQLTLDKAKLTAAIDGDADIVEDIFATGGLATAITSLADQYTRAGDGILAEKSKSLTARAEIYGDQIAAIERNAELLGERLLRQFTSLERSMIALQGQASYLAGLVVR
jgi:flagellar hook-associated protein 2